MKYTIAAVVASLLAFVAFQNFSLGDLVVSKQQANDELIQERLAYNIGTQAYIYAYPFVDMHAQMHNETHRVKADQDILAAVNRLYRFPHLVTPETGGNLRAPNNDTLYFSGWFDISERPLIIHVPDTAGRYYTIAVTNQYSEVTHIGRRTTGTEENYFALTAPGWQGELPAGVTAVPVETNKGWLLGRMLVNGEQDFDAAMALVDDIWLAGLDEFEMAKRPEKKEILSAQELAPLDDMRFFKIANEILKTVPHRPRDAWLLKQFDRIGLGPGVDFDASTLTPATKRGLELALEEGAALVLAATQRTIKDYNGWMISKEIGRYTDDYLHRASVVKGGFGNLPEESLYPAMIFDADGNVMHGSNRYQLTFDTKDDLPPVNAFWSLAVYQLSDLQLVENDIQRYSIGDRTEGLSFNADGGLTIQIQHERPASGEGNWLPSPSGHFMAVMRFYEPKSNALDFSYLLPRIEKVN